MSTVTANEMLAMERAAQKWFGASADVSILEVETVASGASGAPIRRVRTDGREFVLKQSTPVERDVLAWLEGTESVPRMIPVPGAPEGAPMLVLEDLGTEQRPTSLDVVSPELRAAEAAALVAIHVHGGPSHIALPSVDHAYLNWTIEEHFFRPAWTKVMRSDGFRERFASHIPDVERAAGTIVAEMTQVCQEPRLQTLVHTDLNPSNVLIHEGRPRIIDWGTAHVGPLIMDLPHHFETREIADIYRIALADGGRDLPATLFDAWYATAARYTGLRYIWWTLNWFGDAPDEAAPWVEHYLGLIVG